MKTHIKFLLVPFVMIAMAMSSPQELLKRNYQAYLTTDKESWKQNVALANKLYQENETVDNLFALAQTEYGLLNITMKDEDEDLFDDYVDNCEDHLKELIKNKSYEAEAKALLSSVYGYKMAYSPWKSMTLGPKGSSLLDQAIELNPDSPIVLKMMASNKYFTPSMWGGDVDKSLELFQKSSLKFAETDSSTSWMHLDNMAWEGIILAEQGKTDQAKAVWEEAATIEPNFHWVTKVLLPGLE